MEGNAVTMAGIGGRHDQPAGPLPSDLAGVAALARALEPPRPCERSSLEREKAAYLLDGLLARVAHARGAIDVAMGDLLADLEVGDRLMSLGHANLGDYGREVLDVGASTARNLARLARALRERPVLREAVWRGEVTSRKAETILAVAKGEDEAAWVGRAKGETVRALRAAVKDASGVEPEADEIWSRLDVSFTPEERVVVDAALDLAGKVLGRPAAPVWQKIEIVCDEYLGFHPVEPDERDRDLGARIGRGRRELDELRAWLETEYRRWEFLEAIPPVAAAPGDADVQRDPRSLEAHLRELAARRAGWDELVGHLAMLLRATGLSGFMKFASFAHYCEERLGMSERSVGQRIALARKAYGLPALREALRTGRISYEKAREVARVANERSEEGWIEKARGLTVLALRREIDAQADAQMCSEGRLAAIVPERVAIRVRETVRAVKEATGKWVTAGQALAVASAHFVLAWKERWKERTTPQKRALERDGWRCTAPGCSRSAVHVHHVEFRSRGGDDDLSNLTSLCAGHHLVGIHGGHLRVTGTAPDALRWEVTH